ncbi:hypothetical protein ACQBAU_01100 [Propionibacteriaceae bacterium Y2011]
MVDRVGNGTTTGDHGAMAAPETYELISPDGRLTARVEPGSGGRLVSLVVDGSEVIATCQGRHGADYFRGSFPMAPWCGLLTDGIVDFDGKQYEMTGRTSPSGPKYYHGAVHSWPFEVLAHTPTTIEQQIRIGPDQPDAWPWAGRVRHDYELTDDTLITRLSVHSDGEEFPGAVGLHPWFVSHLGGDPARPADIDFRPGQELVRTADSHREPTPEVGSTANGLFIDLAGPPTISWPGGPTLQLESTAPVWVTYTHPEGGFCVEPWTSPDGPMDNTYVHRVTPDSPCTMEFVINISR